MYEVKQELKSIFKNPPFPPSAHKKVYRRGKGGLKMFLVFKKKIIRWIYFVTFFIRLFINMGVDPLGYSVKFDRLGGGGSVNN